MKKLIVVLMSLCLVFCAAAAFSEETEVTTVNWSDYESQAADVEGNFERFSCPLLRERVFQYFLKPSASGSIFPSGS